MNHKEITEIAKVLAAKLEELQVNPNSRGWDLIIEEVKRQREPRVRITCGKHIYEYVRNSDEMKRTMHILIGNNEAFTVEPIKPPYLAE